MQENQCNDWVEGSGGSAVGPGGADVCDVDEHRIDDIIR